MRGVADSLMLAISNVGLTAFAYIALRTRALDFVGMIAAMAVVPVVFVATLVLVVRDLRKSGMRGQALVALFLSIVPALFRLAIEI